MSERKVPIGKEYPYETPETFPNQEPKKDTGLRNASTLEERSSTNDRSSTNERSSTHFRDSGELDMAVAYVLGEASSEERFGFETALAKGDARANSSYNNATRTIDELSGVLIPENPPPFAKDRIMARVRADSVTVFLPPAEEE